MKGQVIRCVKYSTFFRRSWILLFLILIISCDSNNVKYKISDDPVHLYKNHFVRAVEFDAEGNLWFGADNHLYQLSDELIEYNSENSNLPDSIIIWEIEKDHKWYNIQFLRDQYFTLGKYFNIGYLVEGSFSNMSFFSNYTSTMLNANAFQPNPHSKTLFLENYRAHNYLAVGVKPMIKFSDNFHFRAEVYAMMPYRKIISGVNKQAEYANELSNINYMASTSLVYHTLFGPASLSLNYYDKKDKKFYFVFNFGYLLFNKRGYE